MPSDRQKLDHLFEVDLVLLGILSAAEFQYASATLSLNSTLNEEQKVILISYFFRIITYPLVPLIVSWLIKEALPRARYPNLKMILTEFCWNFWGFTLFFFLLTFIQFATASKIDLTLPAILSFVQTIILILFVHSAYARTLRSTDYFRLKKWKTISAITFVVTYFIFLWVVATELVLSWLNFLF